MNSIFFIILQRMRVPLITVIISFAIAVGGMTLMPGVDDHGQPWHMSLFEAFYVISYTATTIGFGEVPYPFSAAQRLWMVCSIYMTVIPWFYAIGKIISLLQDPALKLALTTARFARAVKNMFEPFFVVCGYAETGNILVRALDRRGMRVVVIELQQDRINELGLEDYQLDVPGLCADAKLPDILLKAGLLHPMCQGVAALTDDDHANLAIAIAAKLMNPTLPVLARAENNETAANMASFGTDHIINPYDLFGDRLAMEVQALGTYLLHEWLTGVSGDSLQSPTCPPTGKWIVCGYGRFGKSVVENLQREHMSTVIIEANPELTGCENCIIGTGAEAKTLREAGVEDAVGIVAGTDNDINNLSIVMTAHEMNPNLFVVVRQNRRVNDLLFEHFNADITMQPSDIIAHECLAHIVSPLLAQFLAMARTQSNLWANQLISRLVGIVGETVPETWGVTIHHEHAPAVTDLLSWKVHVSLDNLTRDPDDREKQLELVPLLLMRSNRYELLPEPATTLEHGDRILFCGSPDAKHTQSLLLNNDKVLTFIIDGKCVADSYIWRWFSKRLGKPA
ncbi:MAG: NAD-binding protein [Methylophilaceae bacterium]